MRGEPQCGEKKSLSLSRRMFCYSIFMLSMLSVGSISSPSPSLLYPSSSSLLLIFYFLFASSIVTVSPSPQCLDDFCLVHSANTFLIIGILLIGISESQFLI